MVVKTQQQVRQLRTMMDTSTSRTHVTALRTSCVIIKSGILVTDGPTPASLFHRLMHLPLLWISLIPTRIQRSSCRDAGCDGAIEDRVEAKRVVESKMLNLIFRVFGSLFLQQSQHSSKAFHPYIRLDFLGPGSTLTNQAPLYDIRPISLMYGFETQEVESLPKLSGF